MLSEPYDPILKKVHQWPPAIVLNKALGPSNVSAIRIARLSQ